MRSLFDRVDDADASSSIGPNSSPDVILPVYSDLPDDIPFLQLDADSIQDDDNSDPTYNPLHKRQYSERLTDEQKVIHILRYIMQRFNARFSLRNFLETLFRSTAPEITNTSHPFLRDGGALCLMDIWWEKMSQGSSDLMRTWVVQRGATVCAKECSWLTNRASEGPHFEDAKYLCVLPSRVTVDTMNNCAATYRRPLCWGDIFLHPVL
jgi:hypothetical protein